MSNLQKQAMKEFYFRPKQIWSLLTNIRSMHDVMLYYYGARSVLFKE